MWRWSMDAGHEDRRQQSKPTLSVYKPFKFVCPQLIKIGLFSQLH